MSLLTQTRPADTRLGRRRNWKQKQEGGEMGREEREEDRQGEGK